MKTVILIANEDEARHIRPILTEKKDVHILIINEGRTRVISTLSEQLRNGTIKSDDRIINIGYVGANGYKKGDILTVDKVGHLFPSKYVPEPPLQLQKIDCDSQSANCYTADNFVNRDDVDMNQTCIVDMELYYIALMLPTVMSIKIVSDELDYNDYTQANFDLSWEKVNEILQKVL